MVYVCQGPDKKKQKPQEAFLTWNHYRELVFQVVESWMGKRGHQGNSDVQQHEQLLPREGAGSPKLRSSGRVPQTSEEGQDPAAANVLRTRPRASSESAKRDWRPEPTAAVRWSPSLGCCWEEQQENREEKGPSSILDISFCCPYLQTLTGSQLAKEKFTESQPSPAPQSSAWKGGFAAEK